MLRAIPPSSVRIGDLSAVETSSYSDNISLIFQSLVKLNILMLWCSFLLIFELLRVNITIKSYHKVFVVLSYKIKVPGSSFTVCKHMDSLRDCSLLCQRNAKTDWFKVSRRMYKSSWGLLVSCGRVDKETSRRKQASLWSKGDWEWDCGQRGSAVPAGRSGTLWKRVLLPHRWRFTCTDARTRKTLVLHCQNLHPESQLLRDQLA